MLSKRLLQFVWVLLLLPVLSLSQVTTSSIAGTLKTTDGKMLEGASVIATHNPSGTLYNTISKKGGVFTLAGLRTGGPYTVKIDYVGLQSETVKDIYLQLGELYTLNSILTDASRSLTEVVVTTQRRRSTADKTGASTVIGQRQLSTLPTISRSINDFTRLTPQANGTSFAGRDGRFNNTSVDGANLNNNFGLSADPLPGGGSNPISIDAIEEVSVNIAPFDVRQSGFTGAGINAITKSGTNTLKGSVYALYRNQDYNGRNVGSAKLPTPVKSSNKIFGGTVGGAIIKNKLFFFVNYESEERNAPGVTFSPKGGSGSGNVSNTPVDSLQKFSDFLKSKYSYNPGAFDNFPNFITKNHKFLAKLDWNISSMHKLTAKYSELVNTNDQQLNGSSIPNNPSFTVAGGSGSISRLPQNRFSLNSMAFANSNYGFKDIVRTGSIELNSNFRGKFSNQFLATFSKIKATRTIPGDRVFPTIDIFNNNGQNYMSAGTDPFTRNNDVINDVFNITNNFTYYTGKHTLTAGATYEYQRVGNMFMPGAASYYAFNSLNDFITGKAPAVFSYTFSLIPGKPAVYAADLKIGQLGIYAQDEVNVNENLKLTFGLRIDNPMYPEAPLENPNITALSFPGKDGKPTNYNTGTWPKSVLYFSPRAGFRYKLDEEGVLFRGGTGLFTGRIPFVYLTNMPTNSFMYQAGQAVTSTALLNNYLFNPDPDAYRNTFSPTPGVLPNNANLVMIDKDFKFPQVWRTNLAFDKKIGYGWTLGVEALVTKDINTVIMRNANQKAPNATLVGPDARPRYAASADRRLYANVGSAIILENATRGSSGSLTAQVSKTTTSGFYGSLAYTMSYAGELTANPGSQATSTWQSNPTTRTQNDQQMYNSSYVTPHRFIGNFSYKFAYGKYFATTISLFGELAKGNNYSYTYNGDVNNDGNSTSDLMFITGDVLFIPQTASGGNPARGVQEQADAWTTFIANTPYLRRNLNSYAGRNESYLPWVSRFDLRIVQDFFTNIGARKQTLQITADILNAGNLFNSKWGVRQITTTASPLVFRGYNTAGRPTFWVQQQNGQLVTRPWQNNLSFASTWQLQLGVRYIF